jgi:hypothetical protein
MENGECRIETFLNLTQIGQGQDLSILHSPFSILHSPFFILLKLLS